MFIAVTLAAIALSLFGIGFSSVWFILIGAALGLAGHLFALLHREGGKKNGEDGEEGTP